MKTVHKSVLIWYSPEEMFALVAGIEHYPEFLPWCDHATVLEQSDQGITAEIGMALGSVHQNFVTRNTHEPGQRIHMQLIQGPFSRLDGEWQFHMVGDGRQRACRVELLLNYGFASAMLSAVVGPVFDRIAASMVDAFVKRAEQMYG